MDERIFKLHIVRIIIITTAISLYHNNLQWDYAYDEEDEEIPLSIMCSNPVLYNATSGIFLVYSKQNKVGIQLLYSFTLNWLH